MTDEQEDSLVLKYFEGSLSTGVFRTHESVILSRQREIISKLFASKGYVAIFSYIGTSDYTQLVGLRLPPPS